MSEGLMLPISNGWSANVNVLDEHFPHFCHSIGKFAREELVWCKENLGPDAVEVVEFQYLRVMPDRRWTYEFVFCGSRFLFRDSRDALMFKLLFD